MKYRLSGLSSRMFSAFQWKALGPRWRRGRSNYPPRGPETSPLQNKERANYGSYFSGTHTHFWKKKILSRIKVVKKENSNGFFRVEDKVGLLRERDQTIVTLETEVSEVTYKKSTNIRCFCGSQLQLWCSTSIHPLIWSRWTHNYEQVISKLNLLQSEKGRLLQNESVSQIIQ